MNYRLLNWLVECEPVLPISEKGVATLPVPGNKVAALLRLLNVKRTATGRFVAYLNRMLSMVGNLEIFSAWCCTKAKQRLLFGGRLTHLAALASRDCHPAKAPFHWGKFSH